MVTGHIIWDAHSMTYVYGPFATEDEANAHILRGAGNPDADLRVIEVPCRWVGSSGRNASERAALKAENVRRGR